MKIVSRRQRHTVSGYTLFFENKQERGRGFAFACDAHGNVDLAALNPVARQSYDDCVGRDAAMYDPQVERREHSWTEPAVGICDECSDRVSLGGFTNTCECGADYSGSGQRLAPREFWGEETGESVADILSVDYTDTDRLLDGE